MHTQTLVVDNRVFLLGLDDLYRERMNFHERDELLHAARVVCQTLGLQPLGGPVEGYYAEDELLAEYFRRMRTLQEASDTARPIVEKLPEFRRLLDVCAAPLFGQPLFNGRLLPTGKDPLSKALEVNAPTWTLDELVSTSFDQVATADDFSLVGLAAFAKDAVVLAALRETAVLYAHWTIGCAAEPVTFVFEWAVEPLLAERANRFIAAFNELFHETLPAATPDHADIYWDACDQTKIQGRCVRLGSDDSVYPMRHYHWGVTADSGGLRVRDFWSTELWTTERFRTALANGDTLPFPA